MNFKSGDVIESNGSRHIVLYCHGETGVVASYPLGDVIRYNWKFDTASKFLSSTPESIKKATEIKSRSRFA